MTHGISINYFDTDKELVINLSLMCWLSDLYITEFQISDGLIMFDSEEDEIIARLSGVPALLEPHIEFVYQHTDALTSKR